MSKMNALRFEDGNSRLIASGTQTRTLDGWKIVKNFQTRVTVLRRLGVKCRIESTWVEIQCSASPEVVSTQLEKSSPESAVTKKQLGRCEIRKARGVCKEFALDPVVVYPILLTLIGIQALKDPPGESIITELVVVVAVTVCGVTRIPAFKQLLFFCSFGLLIKGAHAQDPIKSCKLKDPTYWEAHYNIKVAMTLLAVVLIGGVGVARCMYNRWRPLPAVVPAVIVAGANFDDIDAALEYSEWNRCNGEFTLWDEA